VDNDFDRFYSAYYMQVYSFVLTLCKNRDCAEEITQKTFFKAMTAGSSHRGESSPCTWLCAIAKNLFYDERRVQKRMGETAELGVSDSVELALADEDSAFQIHRALHELPEPYKEVFQLRIFGELSFQKIGRLFGKTENWARVTHHRARLKIRERMEQA